MQDSNQHSEFELFILDSEARGVTDVLVGSSAWFGEEDRSKKLSVEACTVPLVRITLNPFMGSFSGEASFPILAGLNLSPRRFASPKGPVWPNVEGQTRRELARRVQASVLDFDL